ncbi:hypothetical protein [Streptomyces sp. AcE210]|nr:hypothetical protein [Streptomyces sp. AcE210]
MSSAASMSRASRALVLEEFGALPRLMERPVAAPRPATLSYG